MRLKLSLMASLAFSAVALAGQAATVPQTVCEFFEPGEDIPSGYTNCFYDYVPGPTAGGLIYDNYGEAPVIEQSVDRFKINNVLLVIGVSGTDKRPLAGQAVSSDIAIRESRYSNYFTVLSDSGQKVSFYLQNLWLDTIRFKMQFDENQNVIAWDLFFADFLSGSDDTALFSSELVGTFLGFPERYDARDFWEDGTRQTFNLFYTTERGIWSELPAEVPLPATGLMLLSGVGLIFLRRIIRSRLGSGPIDLGLGA